MNSDEVGRQEASGLAGERADQAAEAARNTGDLFDDDFGDYAAAAPPPSTAGAAQPCHGWATPDGTAGPSQEDWADFKGCAPSTLSAEPEGQDDRLALPALCRRLDELLCTAFPTVGTSSRRPNGQSELHTLSSLLDDVDNAEQWLLNNSTANPVARQTTRLLWKSLRYLEEANALKYRWNKSQQYSTYLKTLGMSIQLAQAQKYALPAFAAQLSMLSLTPEKCSVVPIEPDRLQSSGCAKRAEDLGEPAELCSQSSQQQVASTNPSTPSANGNVPLDIFQMSNDDSDSAAVRRPAWEEDFEHLAMTDGGGPLKPVEQSLNGGVQSSNKCPNEAHVLPVLPPPPVGTMVRFGRADPK